jgi:hypothetical protein
MVNYIVDFYTLFIMINKHKFFIYFLARLGQVSYIVITFRPSSIRPSTFHILIFSLETTGPIATNLWWNGPWMAPFQNCVRWSRPPSKMSSNFNCSYMAMSSLTYIPGFSVKFFFQPIYTDYAN